MEWILTQAENNNSWPDFRIGHHFAFDPRWPWIVASKAQTKVKENDQVIGRLLMMHPGEKLCQRPNRLISANPWHRSEYMKKENDYVGQHAMHVLCVEICLTRVDLWLQTYSEVTLQIKLCSSSSEMVG